MAAVIMILGEREWGFLDMRHGIAGLHSFKMCVKMREAFQPSWQPGLALSFQVSALPNARPLCGRLRYVQQQPISQQGEGFGPLALREKNGFAFSMKDVQAWTFVPNFLQSLQRRPCRHCAVVSIVEGSSAYERLYWERPGKCRLQARGQAVVTLTALRLVLLEGL